MSDSEQDYILSGYKENKNKLQLHPHTRGYVEHLLYELYPNAENFYEQMAE
jgi:hypothetical protein